MTNWKGRICSAKSGSTTFGNKVAVQLSEVASSGNHRLPAFEVWQLVCTFRYQAAVNLSFQQNTRSAKLFTMVLFLKH